ncbi:hypothetical protein CC78DRAFT_580861 [Lojkania enalia]|uniref:Uncharacterized protein n=1 Tax=Lojkania enalia TaxID=147567 RepID=A0A9P4N3Z3_9PLEO|nr:hypothetical protein CC78DRAFT_580861 [Didymosphaeria enalia]
MSFASEATSQCATVPHLRSAYHIPLSNMKTVLLLPTLLATVLALPPTISLPSHSDTETLNLYTQMSQDGTITGADCRNRDCLESWASCASHECPHPGGRQIPKCGPECMCTVLKKKPERMLTSSGDSVPGTTALGSASKTLMGTEPSDIGRGI